MRAALIALAVAAGGIQAAGQGDMRDAGYRELALHQSDEIVSSFSGRIESITGADMTLIAEEEANNLPVKANRVAFEYGDEETTVPSRILLSGNVRIDHPEGRISAANVDMDFNANQAEFTGEPAIYNNRFPEGFFGESIRLDLENQEIRVKGGYAPKIILSEADPADRLKLSADDISDWAAFLTELKRQAGASGPTPGKHLVSLLEPAAQNAVLTNDAETLLQQQKGILGLLNTLLRRPEFYNADAWQGYAVDGGVAEQLAKVDIDEVTLLRANRSLLHAAFPDMVAALPLDS